MVHDTCDISPYSAGINFIRQNLASVCRRQILTNKVDAHIVRITIVMLAVYP